MLVADKAKVQAAIFFALFRLVLLFIVSLPCTLLSSMLHSLVELAINVARDLAISFVRLRLDFLDVAGRLAI
jgi:hypothetical protein